MKPLETALQYHSDANDEEGLDNGHGVVRTTTQYECISSEN